MINIDSRLLSTVDENELFLLCLIANRVGSNKEAWPGNETLKKETGWHIEKLLKVKKRLEGKGLLKIKRVIGRSNRYVIGSNLIGNYVNGKSVVVLNSDGTNAENPSITNAENQGSTTTENQGTLVRKNHQVSINQEALTSKELITEELIKEKKFLSFYINNIFCDLIKSFYQDLEEYKSYTIYQCDNSTDELELDETTEKMLKKIAVAAQRIYEALKQQKRGQLEITKEGVTRKISHEDNPYEESNYQINAYLDYCRLTNTHRTEDPEKLPEKLLLTNWVEKFHDYIIPKVEKEEYDPAIDNEKLQSEWLLNLYYWQPYMDTFICKRYNNRIVSDGDEYLKNNGKR